jgi:hypothetical protein
MGRSVMSGDTATLMPSFVPCLRVSDITRVNNGPGIKPLKPRRNAEVIYVRLSVISYDEP